MLRATSKTRRLHIGLFGRRNVGKSSVLNSLMHDRVALVSPTAGTTTTPMMQSMEFPPLGTVVLVDTAGVDDESEHAAQRFEKTLQVVSRADIGVIVAEAGTWTVFEEKLLAELRARNIPVIVAFNKVDLCRPNIDLLIRFEQENISYAKLVASTRLGFDSRDHRGDAQSHDRPRAGRHAALPSDAG